MIRNNQPILQIIVGCLAFFVVADRADGQSTDDKHAASPDEIESAVVAWVAKGGGATTRVSIFVVYSAFFEAKSRFADCLRDKEVEILEDAALDSGSSCGLRIPVPTRLSVSNKGTNSIEQPTDLIFDWTFDSTNRHFKVEGKPIVDSEWNLRLLECFCDLSNDARLVRYYSDNSRAVRKICEIDRNRLRSEIDAELVKRKRVGRFSAANRAGDDR